MPFVGTRHRAWRLLASALVTSATLWHSPALAAQLTLTWADNATDESGFRIERKLGPTGEYAQIVTVGPDTMRYIDATVVDGSTYCYRVRAYNGAGDSGFSNEACLTVASQPPPPPPPQTFTLTALAVAGAQSPAPVTVDSTRSTMLVPVPPSELWEAPRLSKAKRGAMHRNLVQRRERVAAGVDNDPPSPPGRGPRPVPETPVTSLAEFHGTPADLTIFSSERNPIAHDGAQSTILGPTTVNEGNTAIYTGNWFFSYSTNGGLDWTEEVIPSGPATAPFFCCDIDSVYDAARGLFIWSALYCADSACATDGAVRIFVRRTASGGNVCSYDADYTGVNELPDYPHLGLTNKFLYLSTNRISTTSAWTGSDMWRIDLDQIADCAATSSTVFSYTGSVGQRVFVPGSNAQHAMYWATTENTTQLRLFKWPETSPTVQESLRTVSATTFANANCVGGTNNVGVFTNTTAWSISGFRVRVAVGGPLVLVVWAGANDATSPNAYVRGAVFREPGLGLLNETSIFSTAHCYSYPAVVGSERNGHFGLSLLFGGKVGGGGPGLNSAVGIDDDYTTGIGTFTIAPVTSGTHNPPSGRAGDHLTVQRHRPCGLSVYVATAHELNGGADDSNNLAHFVVFGRNRDRACYERWKGAPGAFP